MSASSSNDLFADMPLGQQLELEDDDDASIIVANTDEQSLRSVSTFDLPSPALSSRGATRQSEGKPNRADKEGSWVWRWAEKRPDASGNTRIFCSVKGCSQKKGYALLKSSTSNIRNHLISDHKINATTPQEGSRLSGPLQSAFTNLGKRNSVQFSTDILQRQFCKVLVRHKLPYTLAESPDMLRLLKIAAAAPSPEEVKLCSNSTITRRITDWYTEAETRIKDDLAKVPRVAFTLDGWTSKYQMSFLAVTAHWIDDDWQQQDITIGFERISGPHTGEALRDIFIAVVKKFNLQRKVMSITSDNGSNVLKLASLFEDYTRMNHSEWGVFNASQQHVPCLAHVLNLAVQALLGKDGLGARAPADAEALDVEDEVDEEEGLIRTSICVDADDSDEDEEPDLPETVEAVANAAVEHVDITRRTQRALIKLRKGIVKIRRSPPRLERFREVSASEDQSQGLSPLLDVCTRWGSTYLMIDRALKCKAAYSSVLVTDGLDDMIIQETEWPGLKLLRNLLAEFDRLTTDSCASKTYVTVPLTILIYNKIMKTLEVFLSVNRTQHPDICQGVKAAYEKLRKYYADTDKSPIYSVATAVHPWMRFQYWTDEKWGPVYERNARELVRNVWARQYAQTAINLEDELTQPLPDSDDEDDVELRLLGTTNQPKEDDLELFVSQRKLRVKVLPWWKKHHEDYPRLALMAKDYLAIPASSAASERCFSKARTLLPYTRNRLSDPRIREQMLLDSWADYLGSPIEQI